MGEFTCFPMAPGPYAPAVNVIGGWLITSWFGDRIDPLTGRPGKHGGDDLAHAHCNGAPFYAVKAGRVSQGWDPGGGGNWTSLFCDDGDYVGYGHALRFAPGVHGTHVQAGAILGWIDSTGGSTGAHMHLALNLGGSGPYDDPTDYLRRAADAGRFPDLVNTGSENSNNPEGDWFDMATKEDLEEVVRRVVQEEIVNQDTRTKVYLEQKFSGQLDHIHATSDGARDRILEVLSTD